MGQNETILIAAIVIATLINAFFCITLTGALQQVKEENRELKPGLIWLLLIPVVSLAIMFFVVYRLSASLENELISRNYEVTEKPGLYQGLGFAAIGLMINLPLPQMAVGILGLIGIVLFIQYWIKINWYKKVLSEDIAEPDSL